MAADTGILPQDSSQDSSQAPAQAPASPAAAEAPPPAADPHAPLGIADLTLPDGMRRDAAGTKAFVDLMNDRELAAKDRGQRLIELSRQDLERAHTAAFDRLRKDFADQSRAWQDELRGDQTIGGDRLHASLMKAKGLIEEVLPADDAKALIKHADANGMGNNPALIRMLVNMADRLEAVKRTETAKAEAARAAARRESEAASARAERGGRGWYGPMGERG